MALIIEIEQETDGRWIAEATELPGVICYGDSCEEAVDKTQALALRRLADCLDHGEHIPAAQNFFSLEIGNSNKALDMTNSSKRSANAVSARERFEQHFGEIDLGYSTGCDNDEIDADLAREYGSNHEVA